MIRRVALVALLSVLSVRFVDASSFGRTAGQFGVSPVGSAQYSIPIWAPPGPRGIQPNVSLFYDSQASIGPLGIGWSLAGLGQITRCNLTAAQDAAPAAVALVTGDGYCMNGKRLRLTSGTYGTDGSTYQTEIADFSNITANGNTTNGGVNTGPASFTVQGRDGNTYQYGYVDATTGNGANSQVLANGSTTALSWQLSKVTDRAGNRMVINYLPQTGPSPPPPALALSGMTVPDTILWTPTSAGATTYAYQMKFNYVPNVAASSIFKYVAGTQVSNAELLSSIEIFSGSTVVKDYFLGYQTSPLTGREELISVKECADSAGSNCLLPTTVGYQTGSPGVSTVSNTALSSGGALLTAKYDFNGDGYPDLLYNPTGNGAWYVAFGSASGYGTPVNTGITGAALPGNLNGGSQDGILAPNGSTWYYYTWNGSSFAGTSTGLAYDSTISVAQLADVNGDGRPDLVSYTIVTPRNSPSTLTIYTRLNTTTGSSVTFSSTLNTAYTITDFAGAQLQTPDRFQHGKLRRYDFNGDGADDLVLMVVFGTSPNFFVDTYELISTAGGTSFNAVGIAEATGANYSPVFFTDWNDDKCTDFVTNNTLYVSGCNGTVPVTYALSAPVVGAMDWDGDKRTDLIVANGSTIGVYLSQGTGAPTLTSTSVPYSSSCAYVTMDANGQGMDDLGCWGTTGGLTYYLHNGTSDLATSFVDGYGNSASPTYIPLTEGNYTEHYNDATFPDQDYLGPMNVVSTVVYGDPSAAPGTTFNQSFWYYSGWINLQGRGFEGFSATRTLDSRNGLYDYKYYSTVFPYIGMQFREIVSNGAGGPSNSTGTEALTTLSSAPNQQRYFPYFSNWTVLQWEVGGAENGDLITTTSTSYTFDNYGNATNIAKTVTDNDPGSPYTGQQWTTTTATTIAANPSTWCNSLPTERDVTNTAPGVPTITRHLSFTPDYSLCRETQQVVESGNATYQVTTGYGFDAFGNINSQTVTGIGMAARATAINWGTTGQFPTQVTNPLNQISYPTFDSVTGQPLSYRDPNGITTSWQYDAFGRKNKEIRPDGTLTVFVYSDCVALGGCVFGPHSLALSTYNYSTTGVDLSDGTTFFDQMERPVMANTVNIAGTYDRSDVRYDNLGNVAQQSMPCAFSVVSTPCTYWTTYGHDALGRVTQTQRPISATNSTLQTTTIQYSGRTTTTTDPQGKVTTNITKVTGRVGRTKDHNGYYVNFNRDAFGSLLSVTDSLSNTLRTMTYAYGLKAFRTSLADMDLGTRSYTPDALGEVTAYSDGKGQTFSAIFDALSRMTSRTEPDLTSTWTWGATAASHNIGKLASVSSTGSAGTYSESYTFDSIGRLSNDSITVTNDGTKAFDYTYDATTGLLSTIAYPLNGQMTYRITPGYTYQHGFLQQIFDSRTPTTIWWQANAMNPRGQITQETTEDLSGHPQIVSNRSYDAVTGWLASTQTGPGGGATLQNEAYLYDEMGNVTQRQNNNLGLTENFYYDNLYRLDHSMLGSSVNLQMGYDAMGDITSRSDVADGAAWTYDPVRKHAVTQAGSSAFTYAYDANGNVTSRNGRFTGWTSYNYPNNVSTATESAIFNYGPNRQRWSMVYNGSAGQEITYYVTPLYEIMYAGGLSTNRHYIYAGGRPVVEVSTYNGVVTVQSLLVDHQGSISSVVTDSTGASLVSESFTAFGNRREASTWTGAPTSGELTTMNGVSRQGYTFQTVLGSMGLNHMNGRIEDSVTGRFLSPDPRTPNPYNTQSWNRYSYVNNNPLSFTDPTGFDGDGDAPQACVNNCNTDELAAIEVTAQRIGDKPSVNTSAGNITSAPSGLGTSDSSSGRTTPAQSQSSQNQTSDPCPTCESVTVTAQRQTPDGGAAVSVLGPESLILLAPALEEITVVAARTAASAVGRALGPSGNIFGRARLGGSSVFGINSNSVLRIGWGWVGSATDGTNVFRISGSFIDWLGVESGHIDLFTWPW
jgi:RHS repeat-associated protein